MTNERTFDLGPSTATVTREALWVGKMEIPWSNVLAAGVSYQSNGRYSSGRTALLHMAHAPPGGAKPKEMLIYLQASAETNQQFVGEVRRSLPAERWLGEGEYFAMRKRLGFSNTMLFAIVAGIVVVVLVAVLAIALKSKPSRAPARGTESGQVQRPGR